MSTHLATDSLSAYLDDELQERDLRLVEAHVSECPDCQRRLKGLRRVVDDLQRLPAAIPPPILGRHVEREVSERWRARREEARRGRDRGGFELVQGPIRLGFAMVACLAMIVVLYAHWVAREGATPTQLVVPPAAAVEPSAERVEAGGRVFVPAQGAWWQADLLGASEVTVDDAATIPADAALERAPWLADLLARGPVVLVLDGMVAVVRPAQDPLPPAAPAPSDSPALPSEPPEVPRG
ncbi:MAG TPA: zf-HC2 domain-containing protein [Thermoanaerobaculia bacterium]|nr:zf-HC2 domain-containing protein [Thermoanaerobaculia bacterium]